MARHLQSDFKSTQIFDWDNEPTPERPSEFVPSTGFSTLSGYSTVTLGDRRRSRQRRGNGWITLLVTGAVLGSALFALLMLVRHLRG